MAKKDRPNIVFICADQLGAKFLNCYGGTVPSTPNLDRLAAEGVRFDRYYATHPLCAPNRATMLTGRSAHIHGVVRNNLPLHPDHPTYAKLLRNHGYRTGGFGKFHQWPMSLPVPRDLGFLGFDEGVVCEDPKWGPYMEWVQEFHSDQYDAALALANGQSGDQFPDAEVDRLQGATKEQVDCRKMAFARLMDPLLAKSEWERMYVSPISPSAHDTTFITECALDFIGRQTSDVPFICHISYVDPHDPYNPPQPYASLFSPDDMPDAIAPEWKTQGPHCMARIQDNYLNFKRIADNPAAIRKLRALYHGQLRLMDDQIGRVFKMLRESGLWDNTIVLFTSDHGDHLGDHGMIAKGLPHYDAGIRCPLIVGGGQIRHPGVCDRLTSTLDLFPTFCDWAKVAPDVLPPLEGLSFADNCHNPMAVGVDRDISVTLEGVTTIITSTGYRKTWYEDYAEGQMFDLNADSDELVPITS